MFLALDLTEETLAEAIENGADMIITHHPMIFSGIKKINNHSFTGRKIITLIQKSIVYYAMHTNYDVLGMADLSADSVLHSRPAKPLFRFRYADVLLMKAEAHQCA